VTNAIHTRLLCYFYSYLLLLLLFVSVIQFLNNFEKIIIMKINKVEKISVSARVFELMQISIKPRARQQRRENIERYVNYCAIYSSTQQSINTPSYDSEHVLWLLSDYNQQRSSSSWNISHFIFWNWRFCVCVYLLFAVPFLIRLIGDSYVND
jgi:hypothetical protein